MNWYLLLLFYAASVYLCICLVYYFIQEKLIFVPKHISDLKSYTFTKEYSQRVYHTPNNGIIHALLFRSPEPKGLIFYLHGNTGSLRRWGYMAEELVDFGYDVLALDYRGYGKSKGKRSEKFMHEDVESVFEQIGHFYGGLKTVVYGRSLGTGFAVRLASQKNIDQLILECPFYSLVDVAIRTFPFLPMRILLRYKFYSNIYMAAVTAPIVMFHGTKDRVVRYKSAYNLYKKYENDLDIELVTFVGGKHNNLNTFALFREKLGELLGN